MVMGPIPSLYTKTLVSRRKRSPYGGVFGERASPPLVQEQLFPCVANDGQGLQPDSRSDSADILTITNSPLYVINATSPVI